MFASETGWHDGALLAGNCKWCHTNMNFKVNNSNIHDCKWLDIFWMWVVKTQRIDSPYKICIHVYARSVRNITGKTCTFYKQVKWQQLNDTKHECHCTTISFIKVECLRYIDMCVCTTNIPAQLIKKNDQSRHACMTHQSIRRCNSKPFT